MCPWSDGSNSGGFRNSVDLWTITTVNNKNKHNNSSVLMNFVLMWLRSLRYNSDDDDDDEDGGDSNRRSRH
jgi:hypothetical protein